MPNNNGNINFTPEDIDIVSTQREEISDLIGNPPGWLLHSGIGSMAFVVVVILLGASYVNYPDKIECNGIITTEIPPIELVASHHGIIEEVYHSNGDLLNEGYPIIYLQNTADKTDLDSLHAFIEDYKKVNEPNDFLNLDFPEELNVGDLNPTYSALQYQFKEFQLILNQSGVFKQIGTIKEEIKKIKQLNRSLSEEKKLYHQELKLNEKDYMRNKTLLDQGVISALDFEAAEKTHLQYLRQYEKMESGIIQNKIRIEQLELQSQQLDEDRNKLIADQLLAIDDLVNRLDEETLRWAQNFYLKAEAMGVLQLHSGLVVGSTVTSGQSIGFIIPSVSNNKKYVRALVPTVGIGKMEISDEAIIRINAFPFKEYGSIHSEVSSILEIPSQDENGQLLREVIIALPDPLLTDYNKVIEYTPQMDVTIQIITESNSILGRIFNEFKNLLKNT